MRRDVFIDRCSVDGRRQHSQGATWDLAESLEPTGQRQRGIQHTCTTLSANGDRGTYSCHTFGKIFDLSRIAYAAMPSQQVNHRRSCMHARETPRHLEIPDATAIPAPACRHPPGIDAARGSSPADPALGKPADGAQWRDIRGHLVRGVRDDVSCHQWQPHEPGGDLGPPLDTAIVREDDHHLVLP